jgi:hypothetical protein
VKRAEGAEGIWTEYMKAFGGKMYRPDVAPADAWCGGGGSAAIIASSIGASGTVARADGEDVHHQPAI